MLRPGEKRGRSSRGTRQSRGQRLFAVGLALSLGGCSFLLDFDEPVGPGGADAGVDASTVDAGDTPDAAVDTADAAAAANCDAFEPNDSLATPTAISPMSLAAAICPNDDEDFYSFDMLANTDVTVSLSFDNSASNLDVELYNAADTLVGAAIGDVALEEIVRGPTQGNPLPAGTYRIKVLSKTPDTIDYELTLGLVVGAASQ